MRFTQQLGPPLQRPDPQVECQRDDFALLLDNRAEIRQVIHELEAVQFTAHEQPVGGREVAASPGQGDDVSTSREIGILKRFQRPDHLSPLCVIHQAVDEWQVGLEQPQREQQQPCPGYPSQVPRCLYEAVQQDGDPQHQQQDAWHEHRGRPYCRGEHGHERHESEGRAQETQPGPERATPGQPDETGGTDQQHDEGHLLPQLVSEKARVVSPRRGAVGPRHQQWRHRSAGEFGPEAFPGVWLVVHPDGTLPGAEGEVSVGEERKREQKRRAQGQAWPAGASAPQRRGGREEHARCEQDQHPVVLDAHT